MMQTETQIGWQDYLAIILRRRTFFLVPCVIIVLVSMVVGMVLPKIYRAESLLLVQDPSVVNPLIEGLAVSTSVGERLRILREEMLSWSSLSRLVQELKMDQEAKSPLLFERLIKSLQRDILVQMRGGELVTIAYEDPDPKLAQQLVNTLTHIYMNRTVETQSAEAETAITFIESEMDVYQKKLEDSEHALRDFKELYVMQMPVANKLNEQIIELEVSLARMLVENTEEHPVVVQTKRHIEDLKRTRNDEVKRVIATALARGADPNIYQDLMDILEGRAALGAASDPTLQAAQEAYTTIVQRMDSPVVSTGAPEAASLDVEATGIGSSSASLSLTPREEQELARLTRNYDVHSSTYKDMQERLERANITQRLGESDEGLKFKVLEPARLPLKPVRPDLVKIFFISLLLGMFVGAGAAFVAEYLDQSFQSSEELQAALGLPVVGTISTIVTADDLLARRQRRKDWVSWGIWKARMAKLHTSVISPRWNWLASRLDRALLRWNL